METFSDSLKDEFMEQRLLQFIGEASDAVQNHLSLISDVTQVLVDEGNLDSALELTRALEETLRIFITTAEQQDEV